MAIVKMKESEMRKNIVSKSHSVSEKYLDDLVARYSRRKKLQNVGEILNVASIIAQAHAELGKQKLKVFYSEIDLDPNGPIARKLKRLGEFKQPWRPKKKRRRRE